VTDSLLTRSGGQDPLGAWSPMCGISSGGRVKAPCGPRVGKRTGDGHPDSASSAHSRVGKPSQSGSTPGTIRRFYADRRLETSKKEIDRSVATLFDRGVPCRSSGEVPARQLISLAFLGFSPAVVHDRRRRKVDCKTQIQAHQRRYRTFCRPSRAPLKLIPCIHCRLFHLSRPSCPVRQDSSRLRTLQQTLP
jgi:hypothetical protein